jgi:phospholipid/cholesterol/gamma-HCH transport system substrate-binding protein
MSRRHRDSALLNPVLIGALTVLVAIVAVVLAFQANNGLPFVPRYTLYVRVANAEELTRGAEVHMGGALIGSVAAVSPARTETGRPIAVLDVRLNKNIEPLPINSRFTIRLKGAIGEKYLALVRGSARLTWRNGATVPLSQTGATVDLDQVLSMFTPPTRAGVAASTVGYSNALAGRGGDLNDAIGAFAPLTRDLGPVMRNLAAGHTDLAGFIHGLGSLTGALAPVAQTQASLYAHLNTTFRSLAGVAVPYLQDSIAQTPPTFSTVIGAAPNLEAFARDTAALFSALRPGFATLPSSSPVLADAFATGAQNLPATSVTDQLAVSLAHALARYSANPTVQQGLARLTLAANSLGSPLSFLTPVQSSCNYVTLFLRNIASALSDNVGTGTVLRVVIIAIDQLTGSEAVPSQSPFLSTAPGGGNNHGPLHANPYPNTNSPGQTPECAAGNEHYSPYQAQIGNPPGNVGLQTEKTTRSGT